MMVLKIFFFISSGYIIVWKSKGLFTSKLEQFYKALLSNRKGFAYKMGTQFNNTALVIKKAITWKNWNVSILYYKDNWPRNSLNNFVLKNWSFGVTNIVKTDDISKYVYSGYGITFRTAGSWSFDNDFAGNAVIFVAENISSSSTDNCQNNFLMLSEEPPNDINGCAGNAEKKVRINISKAKTEYHLSLH